MYFMLLYYTFLWIYNVNCNCYYDDNIAYKIISKKPTSCKINISSNLMITNIIFKRKIIYVFDTLNAI